MTQYLSTVTPRRSPLKGGTLPTNLSPGEIYLDLDPVTGAPTMYVGGSDGRPHLAGGGGGGGAAPGGFAVGVQPPAGPPTGRGMLVADSSGTSYWSEGPILQGAFDSSKDYSAGDIVEYDGGLYRAPTNVAAGTFDPTDWTAVTEAKGFSGTHDPSASYRAGEVTVVGDQMFMAKAPIAAGTPFSRTQWTQLAPPLANTMTYHGTFTPAAGAEYPSGTAAAGDTYVISGASYTWTSGDLNGEASHAGDFLIYNGTQWQLVSQQISVTPTWMGVFDPTKDYSAGEYVDYGDSLYRAKAAITAGPFDATEWERLTAGGSTVTLTPASGTSQSITVSDAADTPLTLTGVSGQTAPVADFIVDGTQIARIDPDGGAGADTSILVRGAADQRYAMISHDAASAYKAGAIVYNATATTPGFYRCKADIAAKAWAAGDWDLVASTGATGAIVSTPASGTSQSITAADDADTPLTLTGASGQTANLFKAGDLTTIAGETVVRPDGTLLVSMAPNPSGWPTPFAVEVNDPGTFHQMAFIGAGKSGSTNPIILNLVDYKDQTSVQKATFLDSNGLLKFSDRSAGPRPPDFQNASIDLNPSNHNNCIVIGGQHGNSPDWPALEIHFNQSTTEKYADWTRFRVDGSPAALISVQDDTVPTGGWDDKEIMTTEKVATVAVVQEPPAGTSQSITAADKADTPLTLTGASGQTANLFEAGGLSISPEGFISYNHPTYTNALGIPFQIVNGPNGGEQAKVLLAASYHDGQVGLFHTNAAGKTTRSVVGTQTIQMFSDVPGDVPALSFTKKGSRFSLHVGEQKTVPHHLIDARFDTATWHANSLSFSLDTTNIAGQFSVSDDTRPTGGWNAKEIITYEKLEEIAGTTGTGALTWEEASGGGGTSIWTEDPTTRVVSLDRPGLPGTPRDWRLVSTKHTDMLQRHSIEIQLTAGTALRSDGVLVLTYDGVDPVSGQGPAGPQRVEIPYSAGERLGRDIYPRIVAAFSGLANHPDVASVGLSSTLQAPEIASVSPLMTPITHVIDNIAINYTAGPAQPWAKVSTGSAAVPTGGWDSSEIITAGKLSGAATAAGFLTAGTANAVKKTGDDMTGALQVFSDDAKFMGVVGSRGVGGKGFVIHPLGVLSANFFGGAGGTSGAGYDGSFQVGGYYDTVAVRSVTSGTTPTMYMPPAHVSIAMNADQTEGGNPMDAVLRVGVRGAAQTSGIPLAMFALDHRNANTPQASIYAKISPIHNTRPTGGWDPKEVVTVEKLIEIMSRAGTPVTA